MNLKTYLSIFITIISVNIIQAQFIIKDVYMETTGVSNQGLVSGYVGQAGPYSIWNPDLATTIDIGGLAPGQGIGGLARFSGNGDFLSGTSAGLRGAEMSRYNTSTNNWELLGSLGFVVDITLSAGFGMSGDGNTVVGNSWADTAGGVAYTHAVAWSQSEGLVDLGSLYSNIARSTRADAVNNDGSVVVGWQDFNGPWKSAVWFKNPSGGYFPNQYLLVSATGDSTDEFNQLGECNAVSSNGNWIGGFGDYANNNEPWIWSQSTGLINLGLLPGTIQGIVSGINEDASIVVGWFDGFFGDPKTPFIWTPTGGLQNLNDYMVNVLGIQPGTNQIYTANCMSSNGMYVAGYGVDNSTFSYFAYRLNLLSPSGINEESANNQVKIYPNPATNFISIENQKKADLSIRNMNGKVIDRFEITRNYVLDISKYTAGIYTLFIQSENLFEVKKVVKN